MNGITVERFVLGSDEARLSRIAECYQDVFADPPWNEWKRCVKCARNFGRSDAIGSLCPCGSALEQFWPLETVISDLKHELIDGSICLIALQEGRVIGFSWSYPITAETLENKLQLEGLASAIHQEANGAPVAYIDEIGVLSPYRQHGIARLLYNHQIREFCNRGMHFFVARTKKSPPTVVYHWFKRTGYREIADYGEADGRVVLGATL